MKRPIKDKLKWIKKRHCKLKEKVIDEFCFVEI